MAQTDYMRDLLARSAEHPQLRPVARCYRNAAGTDVLIHLPQSYWDYVDWLEARNLIDFQYWVTHTDQHPFEDWSLSQLLMYWLWLDECRRYRCGDETMTNLPPEGYEAHGEAANDA